MHCLRVIRPPVGLLLHLRHRLHCHFDNSFGYRYKRTSAQQITITPRHSQIKNLSRCADERNTRKLEFLLVQLWPLERPISVCGARSAVRSHCCPLDTLQALRPVTRPNTGVKGGLLFLQVFLRGGRRRGVTSVDGHSDVIALRRNIVVWNPRIPQYQVSWPHINLFKLPTNVRICLEAPESMRPTSYPRSLSHSNPVSLNPYHSFVHCQILSSSLKALWYSSEIL